MLRCEINNGTNHHSSSNNSGNNIGRSMDMCCNDRLLLLWKAAIKLEGSEIERIIQQARTVRGQSFDIHSRPPKLKAAEKSFPLNRNTHNEIERSRRAHLRKCMEELKRKLIFKNDYNFSRITMLNVLRKATSTIKSKEKSIRLLYADESDVKQRNAQLKQKLNNFERQLHILQVQQNIPHWPEDKRMRNFSECSIITTSSEESQLHLEDQMQCNQYHLMQQLMATTNGSLINKQPNNQNRQFQIAANSASSNFCNSTNNNNAIRKSNSNSSSSSSNSSSKSNTIRNNINSNWFKLFAKNASLPSPIAFDYQHNQSPKSTSSDSGFDEYQQQKQQQQQQQQQQKQQSNLKSADIIKHSNQINQSINVTS